MAVKVDEDAVAAASFTSVVVNWNKQKRILYQMCLQQNLYHLQISRTKTVNFKVWSLRFSFGLFVHNLYTNTTISFGHKLLKFDFGINTFWSGVCNWSRFRTTHVQKVGLRISASVFDRVSSAVQWHCFVFRDVKLYVWLAVCHSGQFTSRQRGSRLQLLSLACPATWRVQPRRHLERDPCMQPGGLTCLWKTSTSRPALPTCCWGAKSRGLAVMVPTRLCSYCGLYFLAQQGCADWQKGTAEDLPEPYGSENGVLCSSVSQI